MRITGGTHRGRVLNTPKGQATRPTSDRTREAIFNILAHARWTDHPLLIDATVVDPFAGTGALALDALSRGAAHAVMIDQSAQAIKLCQTNSQLLKEDQNCKIIKANGAQPLPRPDDIAPRSLVFIDPPYGKGLGVKSVIGLRDKNWLTDDAIVVMEMAKQTPEDIPDGFDLLNERAYGITLVRFLKRMT